MSPLLILLRKDLALLRKDRTTLILTFLVPFALIWLFGAIFGVNRKDPGPTGIKLAVISETSAPAATQLVDALRAENALRVVTTRTLDDGTTRPLTEADARADLRSGAYRFALILPADLISPDRLGVRLQFLSNPRNEIETQIVTGVLQKTIFTSVPQLLGQSLQARGAQAFGADNIERFNAALADNIAGTFGGDRNEILARLRAGDFGLGATPSAAPAPSTLNSQPSTSAPPSTASAPRPDILSRLVKLETEQVVGKAVAKPDATRNVGGWAVQFLLFAVSSSAVGLFRERDQGLFQRLLAAPVSRADILWSKFLYGVVLGLVQLVTLFFAGSLLFGIDVTSHLGGLVLVSVAAAAACTAFGMLLAAISPTPDSARGIATFVILVMSAIGGAWFPTSIMPEFIQQLSKLTLVYWSMEGFLQVLWAGATLRELLPTLGVLTTITVVVMSLATWRFNRGKLFG